jgi:hypothetical protein
MWPELRKQMSTPDATPTHVPRPRPRPEAARRSNIDSGLQQPPNRHSVATTNGRRAFDSGSGFPTERALIAGTQAREGDLISWSFSTSTPENTGRGGLFDMSTLNALYERPKQAVSAQCHFNAFLETTVFYDHNSIIHLTKY